MPNLTIDELKKAVASQTMEPEGLSRKQVYSVLDALADVMTRALTGDDCHVRLLGVGTLESVTHKSRPYFNPRYGELRQSDPKRVVEFRASQEVQKQLNA